MTCTKDINTLENLSLFEDSHKLLIIQGGILKHFTLLALVDYIIAQSNTGTTSIVDGSLEIDNTWDTVINAKEGGDSRWRFVKRGAEGGGDTGSQFSLAMYNDVGVWNHDAIKASRKFNSVGLGGAEPVSGKGAVITDTVRVIGEQALEFYGDETNKIKFNKHNTIEQLDIENSQKLLGSIKSLNLWDKGDFLRWYGILHPDMLCTQAIGSINYQEEYIKLGKIDFANAGIIFEITIKGGSGYNGDNDQNSTVKLTAKSGSSTTEGVSFTGTRFGPDLKFPSKVFLDRVGTTGRIYNLVIEKKAGWCASNSHISVTGTNQGKWTFSKENSYTLLNPSGVSPQFIKASIAQPEIHTYTTAQQVDFDTDNSFMFIDDHYDTELRYYNHGSIKKCYLQNAA